MEGQMSEYKIGKSRYLQTELTWAQDKALSQLIIKLSKKLTGDNPLTMKELPKMLAKHDLLGEFWGIVLTRKICAGYFLDLPARIWRLIRLKQSWRFVDLGGVTNTMLIQMFDDFFLINKAFMKKLSSLGNGFGLIARALMTSEEQVQERLKERISRESSEKKKPSRNLKQ